MFREVQEMAGKLIETVSGIGGCMLEAATWLRGIRTVKTQIEVNDMKYLKNRLSQPFRDLRSTFS